MLSKIAFGGLILATAMTFSAATVALPAIAPLVLTVAGVGYVATAPQVTVGLAALAGLAIAKEALILATINDQATGAIRGKRDAAELDAPFAPLFDGIDTMDVADCGKLMVCHAVALEDAQRSGEEKAIARLIDNPEDLSAIQTNAYGKYQWAAYAGSFKNPAICTERYNKCPVKIEDFANLIRVSQE